jgi:hypothetical protein
MRQSNSHAVVKTWETHALKCGKLVRQFEMHPTLPGVMVLGDTTGGVCVVENDEVISGRLFSDVQDPDDTILGIALSKKRDRVFVTGSGGGSLVHHEWERGQKLKSAEFYKFEKLTSIHLNATETSLLCSGYQHNVEIIDLETGTVSLTYEDVHTEHINISRFTNHSPHIFATCSFDKHTKVWDTRMNPKRHIYDCVSEEGNVMLTFSPDDLYLLVSATDNEVKQYLTVDGRLQCAMDMTPLRSNNNYTRSYYMNGGDLVISGSSEQDELRINCAHTGAALHTAKLYPNRCDDGLYVQSLRGSNFDPYSFAVLVNYKTPGYELELIRVNMLAGGSETYGTVAATSLRSDRLASDLDPTTVKPREGRERRSDGEDCDSSDEDFINVLLAYGRSPHCRKAIREVVHEGSSLATARARLVDMDDMAARAAYNYMWSDTLILPQREAPLMAEEWKSLFRVANAFELPRLFALVEMRAVEQVTVASVLTMLDTAHWAKAAQLVAYCIHFLVSNIRAVMDCRRLGGDVFSTASFQPEIWQDIFDYACARCTVSEAVLPERTTGPAQEALASMRALRLELCHGCLRALQGQASSFADDGKVPPSPSVGSVPPPPALSVPAQPPWSPQRHEERVALQERPELSPQVQAGASHVSHGSTKATSNDTKPSARRQPRTRRDWFLARHETMNAYKHTFCQEDAGDAASKSTVRLEQKLQMHQMVELDNGSILALNGYSDQYFDYVTLPLYDPLTHCWHYIDTVGRCPPSNRTHFNLSTVVDGASKRFFCVFPAKQPLTTRDTMSVHLLDTQTWRWELHPIEGALPPHLKDTDSYSLNSLSEASRWQPEESSTIAAEHLVLFGGLRGRIECVNDVTVVKCEPCTGDGPPFRLSWLHRVSVKGVENAPTPRLRHTSTVLAVGKVTCIVVFGGVGQVMPESNLSALEVSTLHDRPPSARWLNIQTTGRLPTRRIDHAAAAANRNSMMIWGGQGSGESPDTLWFVRFLEVEVSLSRIAKFAVDQLSQPQDVLDVRVFNKLHAAMVFSSKANTMIVFGGDCGSDERTFIPNLQTVTLLAAENPWANFANWKTPLTYFEEFGNCPEIVVPPSTFVPDMHVLLDDAPFADVTFVFSDGATLKAHRPILMRRSERFNALFSGGMVESRDGNISVVSAERSTFKALLEYLYTDDIRMDVREDSQLVMSLFLLAHEYAFVRLLRLCEGILIRFLQVENCAEFLDYAEMYGSLEERDHKDTDTTAHHVVYRGSILREAAMAKVLLHYDDVVKTDGYLALSDELKADISCRYETSVYGAKHE